MTERIRVSLRRLLHAGLLCLGAAIPHPACAQTNSPAPALPANRYLIILETSHAMQRRAAGALRTINDLIGSRMRGQLHLKDTIGVWTFNDTLYTGKLPLQDWSEGESRAIDGKILDFLQEQKFEKQANLDKVIPAIVQVVKKSEFITVILISEGSQEVHGTPFDQQINQSYTQWKTKQQQARMPFVTVLRARRGQFTNYSVTPPPWQVDMPPLPDDLVKPKAPPSLPVVSATKPAPPPPMAPPLIISGRKPAPAAIVPATTNSLATTANSELVSGLAQTKQSDTTVAISAPPPAADQKPATSTPPNTPPPTPSAPVTAVSAGNAEPSPAAAKLYQDSQPNSPLPVTQPAETKTTSDTPPSAPTREVKQSPQTGNSDSAATPEMATAPLPSPTSTTRLVAMVTVIAGLAAATGIWFWKRRTRPAPHVSLITRSLDREKH